MSELRERAEALLRPAIASLDALTAAAGASAAGEEGRLAGQFVEFKLYATYHLGDQIREALRPTVGVGHGRPPVSKTLTASILGMARRLSSRAVSHMVPDLL